MQGEPSHLTHPSLERLVTRRQCLQREHLAALLWPDGDAVRDLRTQQLTDVERVGRCDRGAVHGTAVQVHPHVHLHPEVPLIAFLGLVQLRITCLRLEKGKNQQAVGGTKA